MFRKQSALIVLAALLPVAADAGRPLATEDAGVLAPRECEWESFAAREKVSNEASANGWTTQVGCGFGWNSQVALAYGRARAEGLTSQALALLGKTALIAPREGATALTLAWGLDAQKAESDSFRHEGSFLNLVATRELAQGWVGHANLGWAHGQDAGQSRTTWNLAAEYAIGHGVELMGEVYGDDRTRPWIGTGLRWAASERLGVNASAAVQSESPRVRLFTLGFKLGF